MTTAAIDTTALHAPEEWDYRPFLRAAVCATRARDPKTSFTTLSKRIGLRSRSFLQHVIAEEKHFSVTTAERAASALGVTGRDRAIFLALVRLASAPEAEAPRIRAQIRKAREKARTRFVGPKPGTRASGIYGDPDAMIAFAALGRGDEGATEDKVAARTGLSPARSAAALAALERSGLAKSRVLGGAKRFYADSTHVYDDSEENRLAIRSFFADSAKGALKAAETAFDDRDKLFSAYAFSVSARRLPELRARLGKTLSEFVVDGEDPDGDRVARLAVSLY